VLFLFSWRRARGEFGWRAFFKQRRETVFVSEMIFLAVFGLFLLFRLHNPDIYWSESSMDFSFINSILRSRSFPPIDPWASGIYLNYYYYGHYLVAMLTKLSGIPSYITYNLCFCLIPALVISCIFSVVYTITGRIRYGLLGGIFAGLMGNLDGFFLLVDTYPWREAFYRFCHIAMPTHREPVFRFFRCAHEVIAYTVHEFPLWSFIFVDLHAHVIAMPFGVMLIALGLNVLMDRRRGVGLPGRGPQAVGNFLVAAVLIGMMVPMNTWDFPTYLILLALVLVARETLLRERGYARVPIAAYSIWWNSGFLGGVIRFVLSIIRGEGPVGAPLRVAIKTALPTALLALTALAAYSPFFQFFGRQGMGIGLVGNLTTGALSIFRFFGFFIFIIASFFVCELLRFIAGGRGRFGRTLLVLALVIAAFLPWALFMIGGARDYATLSIALALLFAGLIVLARNRSDRPAVYALILILYGCAVIVFCELFHIRDFLQGGSHKRMNTIFKFYMPVWFFFSIGGAYCLSRIFKRAARRSTGLKRLLRAMGRIIWRVVFIALFAASLVFTVMGPRARTIGNDNYGRSQLSPPRWPLGLIFPRMLIHPTLDGLAYMRENLPNEYDAIHWLNENVKGQPAIAEATEGDYLYQYARICSNTGIPAVLGWWSHVDQRGYPYRDVRKGDVFKLYKSSDPLELSRIIAKYGIDYVYVGPTERRIYSPSQLDKFSKYAQLFTPVFRNKDVAIYKTNTPPAMVRESGEEAESIEGERKAPIVVPRVRITGGGEGAGPGEYKEPRGITLGPKGNIYVADFRNYRIQKFDAKGRFVTAWGEDGNYPGQFKDPCGVAVDGKGRVYVADTFNHRVQAFDEKGKFLLQFEGTFFAPRGVCVDGKGRIWVADTGNGALKLFSKDGKPIEEVGRKGSGKGEFMSPTGVAVDRRGNVYVADTGNKRVQVLDRKGNYVSEFPVEGWEEGVFNEPGIDVDKRGDVYLTDPRGHRALRYSRDGKLLGVLKPMDGVRPLLSFPMGIAVEEDGRAVYVVDCRNHRIAKFSKGDFKL
jgi:YYY domain-containing protein